MKSFLSFVIILVLGYFLAPIVTIGLFFVFKNGLIGLINFGIISSQFILNIWAFIIENFAHVERYVCAFPFSPTISWLFFSSVLAATTAFIISVIGLRRSYLKLKLIFAILCILFILFTVYISSNIYEDYSAREKNLQTQDAMYLKIEKPNIMLSFPDETSTAKYELLDGYYVYLIDENNKYGHIRFNSLKEGILEGYIKLASNKLVKLSTTAIVTPSVGARIRAGAGAQYKIIKNVPPNIEVKILDKKNDWYYIEYSMQNGTIIKGYIYHTCLEIK